MSITKKFIFLLSLGIAIFGIAAVLNISLAVFIIYNLVCVSLLIIDYYTSIEDDNISIQRISSEKLSIYEKEMISFEVYNTGDNRIYLEMKDEVPDFHFKVYNKLMSGFIEPHEKKILSYYVIPTKRGAFEFKKLHVKYKGRLKLCFRHFKVNASKDFKVYPNMKNLSRYKISQCNNRRFVQGEKRLKMLGLGTSFESLRDYVQGDEYRKINWKATARGEKIIINQYEPEKNQHVHIFIDTGRPMSYTVRGYRKLDMAVNTALVISDMVNQNGDESALLLFNTEVNNMIAPGKGINHRNKIMEALYHIDCTNMTSNYDDAFFYFKTKEKHRSIIFFFTDFETLEEAENIRSVLPIISRNNLVIIVLIKNESLEQLCEEGIKDEETLYNKGVALELLQERKNIIKLLNGKGMYCIECTPENLVVEAVNKYIQLKNKTYF
ncbi:MAG: DUF58 domain-containing protein [Bacillota bacterium]|nr:DUF58 domain-containing protein [Bacillota bacterium]